MNSATAPSVAQSTSIAGQLTLTRPAQLAGVQIIQVESSTLPGEIEAGDLLKVNFDQQWPDRNGLYVVVRGSWSGVRRFTVAADGALEVLDIDRWIPVAPELHLTVRGRVQAIYKSREVH